MAKFQVTSPEGQTFEVTAPDGASQDDVLAYAKANMPKAAALAQPKKPSVIEDMARSGLQGLRDALTGTADMVANAGPIAPVLGTLRNAANVADRMSGRRASPTVGNQFISPVSQAVEAVAPSYVPKTTAGRYTRAVGQFAPAAFGGEGSVAARAANVFLPAVTSQAAGDVAHSMGAAPVVEQGARMAGALGGGALASMRFSPRPVATPDEQVANVFAQRAKADPQAMAAKAAEMRSAGVDPTLVDVTGTPGQRLTKAVGITNEQAGETLQKNAATTSATTKPAVMDRTRSLVNEAQTADQLAAHLDKARSNEASTLYAEPYAAKVELKDPRALDALRDPEGIAAINRAIAGARARMDQGAINDLQALKATATGPTGNAQVWPTTGRALDRVQIAFGARGKQLAQGGANDIASGMFMRQALVNKLLDGVEGLQPARAAFRAKSQAIDILNGKPGAKLDPFSTDPTDYAAWLKGLSPEAQHANQVALRQDILDTLGGQRASTVGSIDELATSSYARHNLSSALGGKAAEGYLANLTARLAQKRNATQVSPYAGSPTKMLQQDTSGLDRAIDIADTGAKASAALGGHALPLMQKLATYLKTRGLTDAQSQQLAQAAVDPQRLDGVISALNRLKGPQEARSFVNFRGGLLGAVRAPAALPSRTPRPAPR